MRTLKSRPLDTSRLPASTLAQARLARITHPGRAGWDAEQRARQEFASWPLPRLQAILPTLEAEAQAARDLVERPPETMTGAEWTRAADQGDRLEGRLAAARWTIKARGGAVPAAGREQDA